MNRRLKIITILSIITIGIFSLVYATFSVSAISESEMSASITKKVRYQNLQRCYSSYIKDSITTGAFDSANDLFNSSLVGSPITAPEGWSGISEKNCNELIGNLIGSIPTSEEKRGEILEKLGYTNTGNNQGGARRCLWFDFTMSNKKASGSGYDDSKVETQRICANVEKGGVISGGEEVLSGTGDGYAPVIVQSFGNGTLILDNAVVEGDVPVTIAYTKWDSLVSNYKDKIEKWYNEGNFGDRVNGDRYYVPASCDNGEPYCTTDESTESTGKYEIVNREVAASVAASNYLGLQNGNFTTPEKVSLYQFYLRNNSSSIVCNPTDRPNEMVAHPVKLVIKSQYYENCYAVERNPGTTSVHAVNGSFSFADPIDYQGIIDALNNMTAQTDREGIIDPGATIGTEMGTPVNDPDNPDNGEGNESPDVCYGSSGTLGLSWIVCPIITFLSDGLNDMYSFAEDNFLKVPSDYFNKDVSEGGTSVRGAWQTFRDVANIVFVIFLLVVIFSQLTGIGIDNYGIKKILPRLIICAILVNLSYVIVQLLIDASNIVGVSLRGLFGNFTGSSGAYDPNAAQNATATIIGIGIPAAIIFMNPAVILTFLLALLSGVIAMLTLLAMLIAREVGIIVAIVLAPLAIVCYLLPNTSKWTKSWIELIKGLLLLYPLCALLVGGSAFVSGILASEDNATMNIVAMLVRVLPFFALPTLFRKSLSAMGNLGATIQGIGRGASRGLTRRISSTEGYKNLQKAGLERQNRIRAGLDEEGRLTARGERRARIANSGFGRRFGLNKLQATRITRAGKAREEGISSAAELGEAIERRELVRDSGLNRQDYLRDQLRDALSSGRTSDYFAAVDQAAKSGMKSSDIAKITREIFDGNHWGGTLTDEGERGNFLQEFANRYGGSFLKKDAEQRVWAATRGGVDVDSTAHPAARGGLNGFASRGGMETADLKDNEIIDLSAERLHELLRDGIIDQAQAQRVWSSGANMDSINKLMLGAMGTRGELVNKRDAQAMTSNTYAGGLHGLDRQAVQALTEATPQDTVIRDVRWKNEEGRHEQTDPLIVRNENRPPQNPNPPIWTPNNSNPPAQGGSSS